MTCKFKGLGVLTTTVRTGGGDRLKCSEHLLLLRRTQVQDLVPHGAYNLHNRGSKNLLLTSTGTMYVVHIHTRKQNTYFHRIAANWL